MSLTDIAVIDLVTRLPGASASAALLIYDTGEIANEIEREEALRKKLSAYLLFVESGQFAETHPALADAELSVEVICSIAPTDSMKLIEGVSHPGRPDLFLPVHVSEEAEFRMKLGLTASNRDPQGAHS